MSNNNGVHFPPAGFPPAAGHAMPNVVPIRPAPAPTPRPGLPEPAPAAPQDALIHWPVVADLRRTVATEVAAWSTLQKPPPNEQTTRAYGRKVVMDKVRDWAHEQMTSGSPAAPSQELERAMVDAVFDAAFGLGRLEKLLRDPDIENIEVNGCDQVWLVYADGRLEIGPPIADSDDALIADLQYWASRQHRTLSRNTKPSLHLDLPDGMSRLAAMIETTPRPTVVIRRHRLVDVTLADLVGRGTISEAMAAFLTAAVRSNANVVLAGPVNSGKTTLLRAMAAAIPKYERYATLETDYELHLDKIGRHPRMVPFQARQGNSEIGPDGRPAGQVTLRDLVEDSLRMNFSRLIVGEVRGEEIMPMLEAVSTGGKGSLCTIHANNAKDAMERIVSLCLSRAGMNETFAYRLAAGAITYVVNIDLVDETLSDEGGRRRRYVNQIVEVTGIGETGRPDYTDVFSPGPDGRGVPRTRPTRLPVLQRAGLSPGWFGPQAGDGGWAPIDAAPRREPAR